MAMGWRILSWFLALAFTLAPVYSAKAISPDLTIIDQIQKGTNNYLIVMIGLFAGLTGFLYFLVQWAVQRLPMEKDAIAEGGTGHGNPLIVSWIMIVGCGLACIIGANALFVEDL